MALSSAPRKRTKKALMKNVEPANSDDDNEAGFLVHWFNGNKESIEEYHKEYNKKAFVNPKFLRMEFLRNENLNQVPEVGEICEAYWKHLSRSGEGLLDQYVD